ncbi:MAG: acyl--CoA ligase [Clostridia bacterium]|nr:acyl--CoA ligase [Clostridia bacterium]
MRPVKRGLISYLESFAKTCPNKVFLHSETRRYTAPQTLQKVRAVAAFLREKGVEQGDYVGISGSRTINAVMVFLATQYLGAVAVMFDPHAPIAKCKEELGIDVPLKLALDSVGEGFVIDGEEIPFDELCGEIERPEIDIFAPAIMIFTSGSTGRSKGVMLCQYGYVNHQRNYRPAAGYAKRDSGMQLLPIFHVFGFTQIVDGVLRRCPLFFPREVTPDYVLQCIEKYRITRFGFVPTFALMMADVQRQKGYDTSSMKAFVIAGAPVTFEQFMYIQDVLKTKLVPAYGMTEIAGISGAGSQEPDEKRAGSVGRVLPMNRVKIEADGEITVKGPALFLGYYGEAPIDRSKFFHTGDLGYFDEEGYLHISGRKKEIIIRNGNNLSPLDIEEKLLKLPFVDLVAVIGLEDEKNGEVPVAAIVLRKGAAYDEEAVRAALNKLEMPTEIRILEQMPLNATGKIDKLKIRELFRA